MTTLFTLGIIPVLKNSRLRIYSIVSPVVKPNFDNIDLGAPTIDEYLREKPVQFSGLGEFQAVHQLIGYTKDTDRNRDYNLVEIDPAFHIGEINLDKTFSSKPTDVPEDAKKKITFEDIQEFINWVNDTKNVPKLLTIFESVDGYVKVLESALKALTDKVVSDYKFNQLVDGIKGNDIQGVISVKTDEQGNPVSKIEDVKDFSQQKTFSTISLPDPDTRQYSRGNLIGTLAEAYKFVRFFHWQTRGSIHEAFQSLYEALVDPTDMLAEKCIVSEKITTFSNEVFPKGDPVDYLNRLKSYIIESSKLLFGSNDDASSYQTIIDDIVNAIDTCQFRIQNPDGTRRRVFSVKKDKHFIAK